MILSFSNPQRNEQKGDLSFRRFKIDLEHLHLPCPPHLSSLVLHTANADASVHTQQPSKMTAGMKSTAHMLQEIQCGTAAEVSHTSNQADCRSYSTPEPSVRFLSLHGSDQQIILSDLPGLPNWTIASNEQDLMRVNRVWSEGTW